MIRFTWVIILTYDECNIVFIHMTNPDSPHLSVLLDPIVGPLALLSVTYRKPDHGTALQASNF